MHGQELGCQRQVDVRHEEAGGQQSLMPKGAAPEQLSGAVIDKLVLRIGATRAVNFTRPARPANRRGVLRALRWQIESETQGSTCRAGTGSGDSTSGLSIVRKGQITGSLVDGTSLLMKWRRTVVDSLTP
jgi:hypothetical protein